MIFHIVVELRLKKTYHRCVFEMFDASMSLIFRPDKAKQEVLDKLDIYECMTEETKQAVLDFSSSTFEKDPFEFCRKENNAKDTIYREYERIKECLINKGKNMLSKNIVAGELIGGRVIGASLATKLHDKYNNNPDKIFQAWHKLILKFDELTFDKVEKALEYL